MAKRLIERAWTWLHTTFPERQLYLRSNDGVQFFTLSPTLQVTSVGLLVIFLGWVAFASVNVIFKDRIIEAKDHRYAQMRSLYESQLADLQLSYDQVNDALVDAEDRFRATTNKVEAKQRAIVHLLQNKETVTQGLARLAPTPSLPAGTRRSFDSPFSSASPTQHPSPAPVADGSVLDALPLPPPPAPRVAKPVDGSMMGGLVGLIRHVLSTVFTSSGSSANPARKLPAFRVLAAQTARVAALNSREAALLVAANRRIKGRIVQVDRLLRAVGLNPGKVIAQHDARGIGGPEFPLSSVHMAGISDTRFTTSYVDAAAHMSELDDLYAVVRHVPLTTPVHGPRFDLSSGFGPRIDPFTQRLAFHPGLDFAGPWGSPIHATASGRVIWAGPFGGYGNMVEINDGFGIRTRYGHMSKVLVHVGEQVTRGMVIGRIGSTGRSTGPHVHYEIWVGNRVVNPGRFLAAGRHILG
ncbi:MAG: M23 family metallopeptidase [Alphaproteobacteria bacterium]|nr:M23 family metallopeptidase [Alphaproteobacteria bacterium]